MKSTLIWGITEVPGVICFAPILVFIEPFLSTWGHTFQTIVTNYKYLVLIKLEIIYRSLIKLSLWTIYLSLGDNLILQIFLRNSKIYKKNKAITHQSPSLHLLIKASILAIFDDFLKYLFILIFIKW